MNKQHSLESKLCIPFPALRVRNYQLYFSGQLISLCGTWLQTVAQGWLVLQLTSSAFLLGLVAAASMLPSLLFSLLGGVMVDRFPKRKILLFTQTASMCFALILGVLTLLNIITVTEIVILAFLLGTVNAVDVPARQSFVIEMVGRDALASAIALNSGIFNAARVIGPGFAGILIALVGTGGTFIINGLSYIAVIIALLFIRIDNERAQVPEISTLTAIREGIQYAFSEPVIRTLLLFVGVTSVFGWSYSSMLPIIARNIYRADATVLGHFYSATGIGAVIAMVLVSAYSRQIRASWFILGGNILFVLSLVMFTFTVNLAIALLLLLFAGLGLISQMAMINTTIQRLADDRLRGRVMAIYALMVMGLAPLGHLEVGYFTEHYGPRFAIRFGAAVVFIFAVILFLSRNRIRTAHKRYRQIKNETA
ncbi:MAG: MFS transporter [Nitrospirae bacterium]|nr:MFS transporter [Nitrospirota bacterium]